MGLWRRTKLVRRHFFVHKDLGLVPASFHGTICIYPNEGPVHEDQIRCLFSD